MAYIIFDEPQDDLLRPPCINPEKWITFACHICKFLGYIINSHQMLVIWPQEKRDCLCMLIDVLLYQQSTDQTSGGPRGSPPRDISRVLGLNRHGALVAPYGNYMALRLQFQLNDQVMKYKNQPSRWWGHHCIIIKRSVITDLKRLRASLDDDCLWAKKIGLMIPRDPHARAKTDSSSNGLGGWSAFFDHM